MKDQNIPKKVPNQNFDDFINFYQDSEDMGFAFEQGDVHETKTVKIQEEHKMSESQLPQRFLQGNWKQWTDDDQKKLIELHKKYGNRWTRLTLSYPGTDQNFIKNHFYSRLRKSMRKLNKSLDVLGAKKVNKFKLNIIFKLSNIAEAKMSDKSLICPQIIHFYRIYLYRFIQFSENENYDIKFLWSDPGFKRQVESLVLPLIALDNLFRLVRSERIAKGKKKNIAYLRQFNFRLSLQDQTQMIITKEHIFLKNYNPDKTLFDCLEPLPRPENIVMEQISKTNVKKGGFSTKNTPKQEVSNPRACQSEVKVQEEPKEIQKSLTEYNDEGQEDHESRMAQDVWKEYFGVQAKVFDFCADDDQIQSNLHNSLFDKPDKPEKPGDYEDF